MTEIKDIPETLPAEVVRREHPRYQRQLHSLRFYRESYEGTGGYAPFLRPVTVGDTMPDDRQAGSVEPQTDARTYLMRHPRERKKFDRRYMMAYLTNVIRQAVQMITGYLTKKQPGYEDYPDAVSDWMGQCTAAGDTWEDYKAQEIVPRVVYYGELPVIFYRHPTDSITAEHQLAMGGQLQVGVINPEAIVDWQRDNRGGYVWLKVLETVDLTGPADKERSEAKRWWYYQQDGWFRVDDDGKSGDLPVVERGTWDDSGMPIVVWRLGTSGQSLIADAASTQREGYNVNSLIQEQERETTFAMLAAPDMGGDSSKPNSRKTGSDNVWWYSNEARHPPHWMAPPAHVLEHFMSKAQFLTEQVLAEMGLDFDKGGGQTGMAFSFKMSKIVRLLQGLATSMQRGESMSLKRVGKMIGSPVPDTSRCVWPEEFDAKDTEKEMDALERILDRVQSATARAEAMVRMSEAGMSDMDETKRDAIRTEVETSIGEDDEGADEQPEDVAERVEPNVDSDGDKGMPDASAR